MPNLLESLRHRHPEHRAQCDRSHAYALIGKLHLESFTKAALERLHEDSDRVFYHQ